MTQVRRLLVALAPLVALTLSVAAQSYHIRVEYNTNIRAQPSLSAKRLETVPAGTTLAVVGKHNRWLKIQRDQAAWMASWVRHERVDAAQSSAIDNCCGIDRQCQSDQEWIDGYWAYQRQECQAPATSSQPSASAPAPAQQSQPAGNNCCGVDRQCYSEQDWINGYWARQNGQCGAPTQSSQSSGLYCNHQHALRDGYWTFVGGSCSTPANASHAHIRITEKSAGFTGLVLRGFELLKAKAPEWYTFVILATKEVKEVHSWAETGAYLGQELSAYHHAPSYVRPIIPEDDITMAEFLVHEACHHHQHREGRGVYGLNVEYECAQKQLVAAYLVGPVAHHISSLTYFINNPHDQNVWWW